MPRLPRHWSLLVLLVAAPAYSVPVLTLYDWGSGTVQFRPAKEDPNRQQGFVSGGECPNEGSPAIDAVWVEDLLVGSVRLCQSRPGCQTRTYPLFAFYDRQNGSLVADVKLDKGCSSPALENDHRLVLSLHQSQSTPHASQPSTGSHLEKGNAALKKGDGRTALTEFRRAVSKEDKAAAYLGIGVSQYLLGQRQSALEAYQRSIHFRRDPQTFYNLACVQVALNDDAGAIENLNTAVELGFGELSQMAQDPDLKPLKQDSRYGGQFKALLRKMAERQPAASNQ